MGPWYTLEELMQAVADRLKESSVDGLEPYWERTCADAIQTGYGDVVRILLGKGYTMAQLDAWDDRRDFTRQQSLFWLMTESSLGSGYDDKEIDKLDRRKELTEAVTIQINGEAVAPASTSGAGGVGGGCIKETGYRITGSTEF